MNKYIAVAISLLLVFLSNISLYAAEQRVVRVGAFNYYPGIFKDKDGVIKGFYVDALTDLGQRENIRFEYVYGSWSEGLERIKSGDVDLLTSVAFTDDRAKFLDYAATPLLTVWGELYVPLASEIDGIREVQGKKIALMKGDYNAGLFVDLIKKFDITCEFIELPGFEDVFKAIAAKKVDAGVVNSTFGVAKMKEYNLRSTGVVFNPFDIFFAVAKGKNQGLLVLLDRYLTNWRHEANSPYNLARQKWSHSSTDIIQLVPRWLVNSFAVLVMLALCSVAFIVVLKKQVRNKTRSVLESARQYQVLSARQEAILAAVPDIIMEADTKGVYAWSNSAGIEFFGGDVIGKDSAYYFEGEQNTSEIVKPLYNGAVKLLYVESWQRRKDGEVRLLTWWCKALLDEDGAVTGTLSTARDITESRRSEEKLKQSENRFRLAIEESPFPIMIHAEDGEVLALSRAWIELSGYHLADIPTIDTWTQKAYGDIKHLVLEEIDTLYTLDHRKDEGEYTVTCKDGSELIWDFSSVSLGMLPDGRRTALSMAADVTQRKRAEEVIRKRLVSLTQPLDSGSISFEELFNIDDVQRLQDEFAKATGVASIITNTEGTPLTAPSNFTRLCNEIIRKTEKGCANCFKSDAVLGRYHSAGPIIQTCLSAGMWDAGSGIVVGGHHIGNWLIGQVRDESLTEDSMRAYAREIGADETSFIDAFHEVPIMSRQHFKQIAQVLFTLANQLSTTAYQNIQQARFINERKRTEEEKSKLENQLHQAQKMESVGRLAGGVAHDFNNMLSVIWGHAELALMRTNPSQSIYSSLLEIRKAAERSADLTRQLLAFARKQVVAPKVINLNDTVDGMFSMLQRLIGENIQLTWQPADNLWPVEVDASQIDQILANLCVNARDAIADVGKIIIETANCSVDANYCKVHIDTLPGEYVKIVVSDNGKGMDKETLGHIFEPFFTMKGLGEGTGLGLSTVYGIVKQNNGFINVYSEPGTGTTFTIYLPCSEGKAEQVQLQSAEESSQRGEETILLVEDEPAILQMTTTILTELGYTVLKADTPGEAIRLAREHAGDIHLLLTDVIMPDMNGRELGKNIYFIFPHIKQLFMSGYTANVIAHHGVLEEGVNFIQKPFQLNALAAKVREVLNQGRPES